MRSTAGRRTCREGSAARGGPDFFARLSGQGFELQSGAPRARGFDVIEFLSPASLDEEVLQALIYPRLEQTHYWSDSWDPAFYVSLARAGFIAISLPHPDVGDVLLPELQRSYAVLDWGNLHRSRKLRRLMASGRLEDDAIELRVSHSVDTVLQRLADYHGEDSWICEAYRSLVRTLARTGSTHFAMHGIELWSRRLDELVCGELGYSIGSTYTSLSGFCRPGEPQWRHFGTLQQVLLARALQQAGYAPPRFSKLRFSALRYRRHRG